MVICTDKKFGSSLVDSGEVRKVERVHEGAGMVYAGVGPDYRVLGEYFVRLLLLLLCLCGLMSS